MKLLDCRFEVSQAKFVPRSLGKKLAVRNKAAAISDILTSIPSQSLQASEILFVGGGGVDNAVQIRKAAQEEPSLHLLQAQDHA